MNSLKKLSLFVLCVAFCGFTPDAPVRVFLIGDSTMADKPLIDNPEHGWGQMIPLFFSKNVVFYNHAKNGRSTRSFLYEGRWDTVLARIRPGDYVFIQFGHNDSKTEDTSRFADARTDYRRNLLRFISDTKAHNAIPVLLTPVNRRSFDKNGAYKDKMLEYPAVVRDVAQQEKVPFIDLHQKSRVLLEQLGDERSKPLYLLSVQPNVYRALPNGKDDNTHFTRNGAVRIAQLVVDGINELPLALKNEIVVKTLPVLPGDGKVIGLDEYYNSEWKMKKDSSKVRVHYVWDDTTNGGFSELARIIDLNGADPDTLQSAPTDSSMRRFSAYIIVDPDTPKETERPNVIEKHEAEVIERWVKAGGVLILMANDKGNCEFEHLNGLSDRFGIHFNEDLYLDVVNNQYDSARITQFPSHPLFTNVHTAFIKQVSSLSVKAPAKGILSSRGITVMAEASYGKGTVFAVGDPWLYNEYIDNRRLPKGYENYGAAESFVRWLCAMAQKVR